MENKVRYQRTFLIFDNEDPGYGAGQDPSGYVKIEVRDGNGKLSLLAQNLKEDQENICYKLYIIKYRDKQIVPVLIGDLDVKRNKAEQEWTFDPRNVNLSQVSFDEFNIAAVVAIQKDKASTGLTCPLVAYKGEKIKWRDKVRDVLFPVKINQTVETEEVVIKRQDVFSRYQDNIISKYTELDKYNNDIYKKDMGYPDTDEEDIHQEADVKRSIMEKPSDMTFVENVVNGPVESNLTENDNIISQEQNPDNQCKNCPAHNISSGVPENTLNLEKLKESFDSCFEGFNPFRSSRKNYIWWKVDNPTNLNNILYSFNLRNPLLFNPKVLMAYYKYRHLTVGIFDEIAGPRKYIVCGIPAVYGIDDRPFGSACKWVQTEGNRASYGSFGYWLVYLDTKTGRLIN